jgi:hypothetical protein
MDLSFFVEKTDRNFIHGHARKLVVPQLQEDSNDFIFMQDGAPPHFHLEVWDYLNDTIPGRRIGHLN